jgi:hypothetical protein
VCELEKCSFLPLVTLGLSFLAFLSETVLCNPTHRFNDQIKIILMFSFFFCLFSLGRVILIAARVNQRRIRFSKCGLGAAKGPPVVSRFDSSSSLFLRHLDPPLVPETLNLRIMNLSESTPLVAPHRQPSPLPKFQLFILLWVQLAEPLTSQVIYPFISKVVLLD